MATSGPNQKDERKPQALSATDTESLKALHRFIARHLRSAQDADDLAQDAYVRYLASRQDVRKPLSFLFKIAENLVSEYRHKKSRERQFMELEQEIQELEAPYGGDPAEELGTADLLNRVLMQVPEGYRKVLILHKRDRMTAKQIAERLGLSERTVEHYVARALTYARNGLWK